MAFQTRFCLQHRVEISGTFLFELQPLIFVRNDAMFNANIVNMYIANKEYKSNNIWFSPHLIVPLSHNNGENGKA